MDKPEYIPVWENANVLIAVAVTWESLPKKFVESLMTMWKPPQNTVMQVKAIAIDLLRNLMVERALEKPFTHLFMLDADMIYPRDALYRLVCHDVGIVSGLSCRRLPPHELIYYKLKEGEDWEFLQVLPKFPFGLQRVDALGGAGTLIKTDVLRDITPPHFSLEMFTPDGLRVGEDIYFSKKATKAGYPLFCDLGVVYSHMTTVGVKPCFEDGRWRAIYECIDF